MEGSRLSSSARKTNIPPLERRESHLRTNKSVEQIPDDEMLNLSRRKSKKSFQHNVTTTTENGSNSDTIDEPKKKESYPGGKIFPESFGSDPSLNSSDPSQPLLPKDSDEQPSKTQISFLKPFRAPSRSEFDTSGSREAIALESMKGKSLRSATTYGTVYSPLYQRLTELRRMSFAEVIERITLTWDHISVYVPLKNTKRLCWKRSTQTNGANIDSGSQKAISMEEPYEKQILKNVSGLVQPGTLLAVLGASGAGKTTLLNVLTYRNRGNLLVEGEIKVNGGRIGSAMPSVSAYVQQEDLLLPTITVKEHLWFQSQLRMDKEIPTEIREDRVEEVIQEMGLLTCADVLIGGQGQKKSISGGERKRLVFAAELLTNPPLMFLDEPTSGLDSYMAQNVLVTLKSMTKRGRSIICTIHQPSSELFELFDQLMILGEGRVAYLGPANEASQFFKSCGYPTPINYNPADHFIRVLAIEPGMEEESKAKVERICDNFAESYQAGLIREYIDGINENIEGAVYDEESFVDLSPYKASWCKQCYVLLWRCFVHNLREPSVFWTRLFQITIIALIFSLVYGKQNMNQLGVANINGALFLMQLQMTVGFIFNVVMVIPPEFPLFLKEHFDGMYRADVYFLCKTVVEVPQFVILPMIFTLIMYWIVGFYNTAGAFFTCFASNLLVCNASVSFGYLLSTALNDSKTALTIGPLFLAPFIMIGGFFINTVSIPAFFVWLKYISWFTYSNEILVVNQWSQVDVIECNEEVNCLRSGQEVIKSFNYSEKNVVTDFVMLLILVVLYRLLALVCFLIRARKSYKIIKRSRLN